VIDDDNELCDLLAEYLGPQGFEVDCVNDGEKGTQRMLAGGYSLVVLDIELPGRIGGFSVLEHNRAGTPILVLAADADHGSGVLGLEKGADDFLTKPFNMRELLARIQAILRRSKNEQQGESIRITTEPCQVGDVLLDPGRRLVFRSSTTIELTSVEFNILQVLLRNAGRGVTRRELAAKGLGRIPLVLGRNIDVHVSRLRKKLGRQNDGTIRIKSIRGSGYIYVFPLRPQDSDIGAEHPGSANLQRASTDKPASWPEIASA
jgi:DNA-binding response OmpR family regulator